MQFTAQQIATILNGRIEGKEDAIVIKLSKIEEGVSHSLSFLANEQYEEYIYTTDASVVLVSDAFSPKKPLKPTCTLIRVADVRQSFALLLEAYNEIRCNKLGIEQPSHISETARLGKDIYVGAFAYIGEQVAIGDNVKIHPNAYVGDNVVIGDSTTLYAGVKIYSDCFIGKHCTLHAGVVVGGDGFGFAPNQDNTDYKKIVHTGNVVIEDNVEIGANSTIDRATLGSTIIRKGVKLDNLIQVAHNVEIGENTVIASQSGVAGSTKIGKNCMIGGQVGIIGHLTIADNVKIAAQSGIGHSIKEEGAIMQGSPAFNVGEYKRSYVLFKQLPKLQETIIKLKKELLELTKFHV